MQSTYLFLIRISAVQCHTNQTHDTVQH